MTLFGLGLAWLAGLAAGTAAHVAPQGWLLLAALAAAQAALHRRGPARRLLFAAVAALCLGGARAAALPTPAQPGSVSFYNDRRAALTVEGVVVAPPELRGTYTGLRVRAERLWAQPEAAARPVEGLLLARAPAWEDWALGDRVRLTGRLRTPSADEGFSYREHLARGGVHSLMTGVSGERLAAGQIGPLARSLDVVRRRAAAAVRALFPEPEASFLMGVLLGDESGIPRQVEQAFNRTGTSHVIAISGFNISILAGMFIRGFGRVLGRRAGVIAAAAAIAAYTLLVGAGPSVVRAALMAGLALAAQQLGRTGSGLASLAAAAVLMTAVNPRALGDPGFQLSFAATLGLILYAAPLKEAFTRAAARRLSRAWAERLAGPVSEYGLFTLAAQVTTLPITLYHFQRLSWSALMANPLILPAQPAAMVLGGCAAALGAIALPLGRPLAWAAWPFAAYTIRTVELFARWASASAPVGRVGPLTVLALYLALFGLTALASSRAPARQRLSELAGRVFGPAPRAAALAGLMLGVMWTWRQAADRPDGRLRVTVLESGAAALIESPDGRFVLVGGGPSRIDLAEALARALPYSHRRLDWLVISGGGREVAGGLLGLAERFPIGAAWRLVDDGGPELDALMQDLHERRAPVVAAAPGAALDLGRGARLLALGQGEAVESLVLEYGRLRVALDLDALPLAPGGAPSPLTALVADGAAARLPPPPGQEIGWRPRLLLLAQPAGLEPEPPARSLLGALDGVSILSTDVNGWIALISDGERLWIEVERLPVRMP